MLGLEGPDEYGIAVCGYTSDLGGKNLQSEWYAIKVPNPDPDQYSPLVSDIRLINPPSAKESEYSLPASLRSAEEKEKAPWAKKSGRSLPSRRRAVGLREKKIGCGRSLNSLKMARAEQPWAWAEQPWEKKKKSGESWEKKSGSGRSVLLDLPKMAEETWAKKIWAEVFREKKSGEPWEKESGREPSLLDSLNLDSLKMAEEPWEKKSGLKGADDLPHIKIADLPRIKSADDLPHIPRPPIIKGAGGLKGADDLPHIKIADLPSIESADDLPHIPKPHILEGADGLKGADDLPHIKSADDLPHILKSADERPHILKSAEESSPEKIRGRSLPDSLKRAEEKEKARSAKESEYSLSASERREGLSSLAKEKEKVEFNPPSAKANEKGTNKTEPLHPFSVVRMMYQSRQHAFLEPGVLISLGGLDPVGSDSDGDGAYPYDSERHRKVWSFDVRKPDAGWKAFPPMTFYNRYDPQSVTVLDELCVMGGFSRSQFLDGYAEVAPEGVGWMEAYHPSVGWICLPDPPSGFSFNDDPFIFTAIDGMKILLAQYNHDDLNCDSATFYVYNAIRRYWTTLDPPVRKLLARYPDRTGRRSVVVGNTLYWGLLEDEDINVQAYDLNEDIWFHGSFNVRPVLGKDEYLADNAFPASPPLLHLANQKFCLFLLTSIYDEKNCEVSDLYLNCLILDVSPINDEGDNHQHDYYDHVCYKVHGDVNVDDKEDNANYHVHPHKPFWRLSISIVSIHKYHLVNPIQLWDAVVLRRPQSHSLS